MAPRHSRPERQCGARSALLVHGRPFMRPNRAQLKLAPCDKTCPTKILKDKVAASTLTFPASKRLHISDATDKGYNKGPLALQLQWHVSTQASTLGSQGSKPPASLLSKTVLHRQSFAERALRPAADLEYYPGEFRQSQWPSTHGQGLQTTTPKKGRTRGNRW